MTVKLFEIFNAKAALDSLFNSPMPAKLSYRIADIIDAVNPEFEKIEKIRQKLVEKHIEEGEKQVTKNLNEFSEEFNDLLQEEVEIDYEPTVSVEDLPDDLSMSPRQIRRIKMFLAD